MIFSVLQPTPKIPGKLISQKNYKFNFITWFFFFYYLTDFDVDGGRDRDIFDINEGIKKGRFVFMVLTMWSVQPNIFILHRSRTESCRGRHCASWGELIQSFSFSGFGGGEFHLTSLSCFCSFQLLHFGRSKPGILLSEMSTSGQGRFRTTWRTI